MAYFPHGSSARTLGTQFIRLQPTTARTVSPASSQAHSNTEPFAIRGRPRAAYRLANREGRAAQACGVNEPTRSFIGFRCRNLFGCSGQCASGESSVLANTRACIPTYKAVPARMRFRRNSVGYSPRLLRARQCEEHAAGVMDVQHLYDCLFPCEPKMGHQGCHNELHGCCPVIENLDAMNQAGRPEAWPFQEPCLTGKYRGLIS
jgi:hypothetical protein